MKYRRLAPGKPATRNIWRRFITVIVLHSRVNPWVWPLLATAVGVGLNVWMWAAIGTFLLDLAVISLVVAIGWWVLVIREFRAVIRMHPPYGERFAHRNRGWSFADSAPLPHFSGARFVPGPEREPVMGVDVLAGPWHGRPAHLCVIAADDGDLTATTVMIDPASTPPRALAVVPVPLLKEFRRRGPSLGSSDVAFNATWSVICDSAKVAHGTLTAAVRDAIGAGASADSAVVIEGGYVTVFAPPTAYHRATVRLLDYAASVADALPEVGTTSTPAN